MDGVSKPALWARTAPPGLVFFGTTEKRIGPGLGQWVPVDSRPGKFPPSYALTLSVVVRFFPV